MTAFVAIDDPEDPRVADYRDIRERDLVGRQGLFIAEGEVVLRVLFRQRRHRVMSVLVAAKRLSSAGELLSEVPNGTTIFSASQAVLDRIAGFPIHRGLLALGQRPAPQAASVVLAAATSPVLMLVGIANHDNMGGLFRNAAAFGAGCVLLDPTCCDPLYRKAIRVSVGAALKVPFASLDSAQTGIDLLAQANYQILALSPAGATALTECNPDGPAALLLGPEGQGLPAALLTQTKTVRIPMAPGFDSLNVATASGIALHHLAFGHDRAPNRASN